MPSLRELPQSPPILDVRDLARIGLDLPGVKFEVVRSLTHSVYVGRDSGDPIWVLKVGHLETFGPRVAGTLRAADLFARLTAEGRLRGVTTPGRQSILSGEAADLAWILAPYVSGRALGYEEPTSGRSSAADLALVADVIAALDAVGETGYGATAARELHQRLLRHLELARHSGWLPSRALEAAADLCALIEPIDAPTRLGHGDFAPWHVIDDGHARHLLDIEFASADRPRFADLAWALMKMSAVGGDPAGREVLLGLSLDRLCVDEEIFWQQAAALSLERGITGLLEAREWHATESAAMEHLSWVVAKLERFAPARINSAARALAIELAI